MLARASAGRLLLAILCLLLWPVLLPAHARFTGADPAPGAVLGESPAELLLHFNEPVQPLAIKLLDTKGRNLAAGLPVEAIDNRVRLRLAAALPDGRYLLSYRVLSADAHPVAASFGFTVGDADRAAGNVSDETLPDERAWARERLVARALYIGTLLLAAGTALFLLLLPQPALQPLLSGLLTRCVLVALLAGLLYLQLTGADMRGSLTLPDVAALAVALDSSLGRSLAVAGGGLLLLLLSGGARRPLLLAGVLLLAISRSITGHPASREPGWLLAPAMALHLLAAAFWYGSLLPLYLASRRLPPGNLAGLLQRFSATAMATVACLAFFGVLMALVHLASPAALLATWYGQLLIMKLSWFAVLLMLAAWHKFSLTPRIAAADSTGIRRLRTGLVIEAVAMSLVVVLSANLASTSPEMPASGEIEMPALPTVETTSLQGNYRLRLQPLRAADGGLVFELRLTDLSGAVVQPQELRVTTAVPARGVEPLPALLSRGPDGRLLARPALGFSGRWLIEIDALVSDFDLESFRVELDLSGAAEPATTE